MEIRKYEGSWGFKQIPKGALPLPKPPVQVVVDKQLELKSNQASP
jgi:hypothetical protein